MAMELLEVSTETVDVAQGLEAERELCRYVEALYKAAKKTKDPVAEKVKEYEKLWKGEHYGANRPSYKTPAMTNFVFSIIETEVTWLCENRPNLIVEPMGPEDTHAAHIVERIITDHLWGELDIRAKLKRQARSSLIRGTGFLKVVWDTSREPKYGGDVGVDYIPWREVFLDPEANSVADARYVIHARELPLSEIVKRWPDQGWRVTADPAYSDPTEGDVYSADVDRAFIATSSAPLPNDKAKALVLEAWIKDESFELHEEMGDDGTPRQVPRFLYPKGRLTTVANGVVLVDRDNPYDDGEFPFTDLPAYETDDSPWNMGEVQQMAPIQRVINMLESRMVDYARLVANTPWIKDSNSGVKSSDLVNREGLVITKIPGTEVRRDPPPPLPEAIFQLYIQEQRNMETITGIHDITQGRKPAGVTAASAISMLQEAGQARIRDKARNLEDTIRRMGRLIVSRITQFYTPKRVVRLRGKDNTLEFVRFDPSQLVEGLDLYVEAGSSLQMNEQTRYQMALDMFKAGAIDAAGLLEASNFPDRDEIIQRIQQRQAVMAQQQAAAAQAGPPLPPGGMPPGPMPPPGPPGPPGPPVPA